MHLLKQQKTPSLKKGIRQIDPAYPVFVDAVMDGMIQGHLYVDDEAHPLVYFLEASCGIYYVAGRSEAELLRCSAFLWMCTKGRKDKTADSPYFQQIH
ncbi:MULTISPECIES: hypothetical protein [unclassified Bacillus (in: firmicutes)]